MLAMLRYRLITGPLMIVALVGLLYLDHRVDQLSIEQLQGTFWQALLFGRHYPPAGLLMLLVCLVLVVIGAIELCAIFRAKGIRTHPRMIAAAAASGCITIYAIPYATDSSTAVAIFATVVVVLFLTALVDYSLVSRRTEGAVAVAAAVMFAFIYLGLLPGFYVAIRRWHSAWVIIAIILIVKSCDIGAYFTGRLLGRHKLIPWLSPGKTWEGLVGGVATSAVAATLIAILFNELQVGGYWQTEPRQFIHTVYPLWAAPIGGAILGLAGQFGDLVASLFKRDAGFKDSGHYIPGFGGFLDVADSPLIVAPLAYWMLRLAAMQ